MLLLNDHIRARQAHRWRPPGFARPGLTAAARRFLLEHAPAIIAGMHPEIGLREDKCDIVAPDLLTGTAAEPDIAGNDTLPIRPPRRLLVSI
ncbi:hypothetical protein GCM10020258_57110 [Sphingomonas yabuuchiae]